MGTGQTDITGPIVVTGGTGFVGRSVVQSLRQSCDSAGSDVEVISVSRSEGVDLRDGEQVVRFLQDVRPSWVVHCAAHVGGLGYVGEHAIEVVQDNLRIALGLMEGIHRSGVGKLVTVMPNCTYPGAKDIYREDEWWDGPIHESVLMYGLPRKTLWGMCKTYGDASGLRTAHLIFPNMYGPGDHFDPKRSHALGAMIEKIMTAKCHSLARVDIWGTGRPVREWMNVGDAASAIVRFLGTAWEDEAAMAGHPIYNVGIGRGISIAELARMIAEAARWDGEFVFDTSRPDGAMQKLLDGSRFERLTGWSPEISLRDGIEQTVAWYQRNMQRELTHAN